MCGNHTIKRCQRCKELKPLGEYHKNKHSKDGHNARCKACMSEWAKGHYLRNKERITQRGRNWSKQNRESRNEVTRRWRERNRDYFVRYRAEHRTERSAYNKHYRVEHYAAVTESIRLHAKANPEETAAKARRYRARKRAASGDHTGEQFKQLIAYYGNRCLCCKKRRKLVADHVVPLSKGGTNDIGNIQPLCLNCNSSKGNWHMTDYRPDGGYFARALAAFDIGIPDPA